MMNNPPTSPPTTNPPHVVQPLTTRSAHIPPLPPPPADVNIADLPDTFETKSKRPRHGSRVNMGRQQQNKQQHHQQHPFYDHTTSNTLTTPSAYHDNSEATCQGEGKQHEQQQQQDDDDEKYVHLLHSSHGHHNPPSLPTMPRNFEYGDHTADIILHGFGSTIEQSFESVAYAMICYMFDHPERAAINPHLTHEITLHADDIPELVFCYLTEILVRSVDYLSFLPERIQKQHFPHILFPGMVPRRIVVKSFVDSLQVIDGSSLDTADTNVLSSTTTTTTALATTIAATTTAASSHPSTTPTTTTTTTNYINETTPQVSYPHNTTTTTTTTRGTPRYTLVVELAGDFIDVQRLGVGTEVKAITRELTQLRLITDPKEVKQKGRYDLQVLVDI